MGSMVREPYDGIIGDAPVGAIPFHRLFDVRDSLQRHASKAGRGGNDEQRQEQAQNRRRLSRLNLNSAGIDVGATSHFVAVPADRAEQPVQEFEAFTADLYRLADWLAECGVETVVMESTGVYWIPLFGVLEERGFQVMLVDPRRIKNVPGRKTGCAGLSVAAAVAHLRAAVGSLSARRADIRRLRSYLRQRAMLVEYAAQHVQHMHKALDPDEREAPARHQRHHRQDRHGHHRGHRESANGIRGRLARLRDPQDQGRREDHRQVAAGALAAGAHL